MVSPPNWNFIHRCQECAHRVAFLRNLQRLGFDASFSPSRCPQYLERTRRYDYDMIIDMFAQSLSPGAEQTYMRGSQAADEKGNQNSAGIKKSH